MTSNRRWECGYCERIMLMGCPFYVDGVCGYCGDRVTPPWRPPREHTAQEVAADQWYGEVFDRTVSDEELDERDWARPRSPEHNPDASVSAYDDGPHP